jgi:hypothetical protein
MTLRWDRWGKGRTQPYWLQQAFWAHTLLPFWGPQRSGENWAMAPETRDRMARVANFIMNIVVVCSECNGSVVWVLGRW